MKVCTDSCIFGAIVAMQVRGSILDIGCGTGLLSLMMAQHLHSEITAVEIDSGAFEEAQLNVARSPWSKSIEVIKGDIRDVAFQGSLDKFDSIVCNPPFYNRHLSRTDAKQNRAMHGTDLDYISLCLAIGHLLKKTGNAYILLPSAQVQEFTQVALRNALHIIARHHIYNFAGQVTFREVLTLGFSEITDIEEKQLNIYAAINTYTTEAINLLKEYYLNL